MKKSQPIIERNPGTKKQCIAALRTAIHLATAALDAGMLHTAITALESALAQVKKKLPREKIVKPFRK